MWWRALGATPILRAWCELNPGYIVYGEVYGDVKGFRYDLPKGEVQFVGFDIWSWFSRWFDAAACRISYSNGNVPQVPILYMGGFGFDTVCKLAEGQSLMPDADHLREGCVVKPRRERWDEHIGRVCLKVVGAGYLEKEKA